MRRFSDFEWLITKLQEFEHYKGLIIPPLPEKKYFGNLGDDFIDKRRYELETFLKVIATHQTLKFDPQLKMFLTSEDLENYKSNPSAYEKVMSMYDYLPNVRDLNVNAVKNVIQNGIVQVRNEIYTVNEPAELKPEIIMGQKQLDLDVKQSEIGYNLFIFSNLHSGIKK